MKLWKLRPRDSLPKDNPWEPWYDKAFGFIIQALDEKTAREIANANGGDEVGPISYSIYRTGGDAWLDPKMSTCEEYELGDEPRVIMRDFAAA